MTRFVISRNFHDRSSALAWLIYDAEKGPETATAVANIVAKNVVFCDSSDFEKIGGCEIIATVDDADVRTFSEGAVVPELMDAEKLRFKNGKFFTKSGELFGLGDSIKGMRLLSDGSMTFNRTGEEVPSPVEEKAAPVQFKGDVAVMDSEGIILRNNNGLFRLVGAVAYPIITAKVAVA